jgi:heme-degrading monooxygenase HmoA
METQVGFAVIYRWRVAPDQESAFIEAWRKVTELVRTHRGGLGSRLHRASDGAFVAYAQWPSEAAWRAAGEKGPVDEAASAVAVMRSAIVERFEEVRLDLVADMLLPGRD